MDDSTELSAVWNRVVPRFDSPQIAAQQKAWIGLTRPIGLVGNTAVFAAPNPFAKEFLENRLRPVLAAALSEELGRQVDVAVTVEHPDAAAPAGGSIEEQIVSATTDPSLPLVPAPSGGADRPRHDAAPRAADDPAGSGSSGMGTVTSLFGDQVRHPGDLGGHTGPAPGRGGHGAPDAAVGYRPRPSDEGRDRDGSRLNPKYTFETFVIGSSNRFTHAAAVAVAEAPARAYNPLFIYGDSGLGKTHLLHAIGHYAQRLQPGLRTRYVSSEEFTNEFINSVRDDKMQNFQSKYRSVDLLLIDDIQFLERAERTQEEFFHTFNTLHNQNKQIVISSDKSPRQLSSLEDRLRTRFEWGLISDVQAPDLETRIAILRKKAAQDGMSPPPDVMEYIASRIQSNIRELEGALIRVTAFANLNRQHVDMALAEMVLKDLVAESDAPEITATLIIGVTAEYFGVSIDDLVGGSRSRTLVAARQMAMYLCRELTEMSLPKIGEKFGNRDHTTVMHAERKIRGQMKERHTVYNQITELTSRLKARARA